MQGDSDLIRQNAIKCIGCSTQNAQGRRFCSDCGMKLWLVCPSCDAESAVGEKFCGTCGVNLQEILDEKRRKFKEKARAALQLANDFQFEDAIIGLRIAIRDADELLKDEVDRVAPLLDVWKERKDSNKESLDDVLAKAKEAFDSGHHEQCVELIESVHANLRTDDAKSLLERAKGVVTELKRLTNQVEFYVKNKKAIECLPLIESILRLKTGERKARALAEKIRDGIISSAKTKLEQGKLEQAWKLISEIRPFVSNDEAVELRKKIGTALWLWKDMQSSPQLDPGLLDSFNRFVSLKLPNIPVDKFAKAIKERAASVKGQVPVQYPTWSSSKEQPHLGIATSWLAWHHAFEGTELLKSNTGPFGSRLSIAIGLALQGLNRGKVDTHFKLQMDGWKDKIRLFKKKASKVTVGLHIGTTAIKVVRLEQEDEASSVRISNVQIEKYDKSFRQMANDFERRDAIRAALLEVKRTGILDEAPIVASIAAVPVLARFCNLPAMDSKRLNLAVENEAKHQIPFGLDTVAWTHHLFNLGQPGSELNYLMLLAVKRVDLLGYVELLDPIDIKLDFIQSDAVALHNLCEFARSNSKVQEKLQIANDQPFAALHYGGDGATIVSSSPNGLWFRYISMGSERITKELATEFRLTHAQAEQLKHSPVKHDDVVGVYGTISESLELLSSEISRSLETVERDFSKLKPSKLFLTGGGAPLHGLMRALRSGPQSIALGGKQEYEGFE